MPLQKAHVTAPFASGLNEKATPQLLQDGSQAVIVNGVFTKDGSIRKRFGTKKLGTSPASPPFRLNAFQGELTAACADSQLRGYSTAPFVGNNWIPRNYAPEAVATRSGLATSVTGVIAYDIAVSGNVMCVVWTSLNTLGFTAVLAALYDTTNGALIKGVTQLDNAGGNNANPRVIASTGAVPHFTAFWSEPTFAKLWASGVNAVAPGAFGPANALRSDMADVVNGVFDVTNLIGTADTAILFYEGNAPPNNLALVNVDTSTNTPTIRSSSYQPTLSTGFMGISVTAVTGDTSYWFGYAIPVLGIGFDVLIRHFGTTAALVINSAENTNMVLSGYAAAGPFTRPTRMGMVRTTATTFVCVASGNAYAGGAATTASVSYVTVVAGAPGAQTNTRRLRMLGRPMVTANGRVYITAFYAVQAGAAAGAPSDQCTCWLLELTARNWSTIRPVATFAPTICTAERSFDNSQICSIVPTSVANQYVSIVDANVVNTQKAMELVTFDFSNAHLQLGAELGHQLSLTGGVPMYYDAINVAEIGFFNRPEQPLLAPVVGGGQLTAGTYSYSVVYEWYDAQGQYHQSQPSVAKQVTVANNGDHVTLTIPCLNLTQRENGTSVGIAVYRTAPATTGTVLFRTTPDMVPVANLNVAANATITIQDTLSDLIISANRPIWNTGGNVPRVCPPSSSVAIVHKDRLWLAGGDDPRNVWFSGALSDGEAPWFSLAFIQRFSEPIVALASMDGRLIAFSRYSVFVMDGDGPSDTGSGSDLTAPSRVNSPSGCIDARSVVRIADGVLFQSEGGYYLITRSLEVIYYGKNVEDTIAAYSTITSAVILEEQGQQRFTAQDAAGTGSRVIIYDDIQKAWSTATYKDVTNTAIVASGAVKWGANGYVFIGAGGVYQEDSTTYLDAGSSWVPLTIISNWFKPQANQGFGRFWNAMLLAQYATDHDLTLSLGFNYDPSFPLTDLHTFQVTNANGLAPGGNEQLALKPTNQKCQAMRVAVYDATPTAGGAVVGTGAGFYAIALDFEIGVKQGTMKLPAAARY